jgi:GAF domain-containing protein
MPSTAIPVLQLSAAALAGEGGVRGPGGGADDHLGPTPGPDELLASVEAWLRARHPVDCLARLRPLTDALPQAATSQEVAQVIMTHGLAALDANAGVVAVLSEDGTELAGLGIVGYPPLATDMWRRSLVTAPSALAEAVRERRPVLLSSFDQRAARYPAFAEVRPLSGDGAVAALPLLVPGRVVGGLRYSFPTDRTFTDRDVALLGTLAGLAALALERVRLLDAGR